MSDLHLMLRRDGDGINHAGLIIGVVIAIVVLVVIIGLIIFLLWRRHKKQVKFMSQAKPSIARSRRQDSSSEAEMDTFRPSQRTSSYGAHAFETPMDQDGEPWPVTKKDRGGANPTTLPPPAPGPFSYL